MLENRIELAAGILGPHQPARKRQQVRRASRQAGYAVGELLVLTVPLCVSCMAIASMLAATASARSQGQWRTSLQAQQLTQEPCGIGDTDWAMTAPAGLVLADSKVRKAWEPLLVSLLPTPHELPLVSKKTVEQTTPVSGFFYKRTADRIVPDRSTQVTTSATFVCNEPEHGDSRRKYYETLLLALGHWQAGKLFGTFGGSGEADPTSNLPSDPDLCKKGRGAAEKSPCDVLSQSDERAR